MQFFKVLPFLFVLAAAFDPEKEIIPTCNSNDDSGNSTSSDNGFSKACSNANINADGWLYVDCDVGSKLMKFGVGLNYCIANDGGNIAVRDE
ncbi:hypothetical protein N7492_000659 [Penicillium capsulatum]|uniref:Cyanovirin-N domain-containing protein n=1 Tax=Penicillium capsulatum TaxID=69766 RepID=A0A9W9IPZ8_9EURO|nr:hypothetical protein N7492_000659 [Penicillium capsulatum]